MPGDYPDYTSPTVEGQTVELDPQFGQPYSMSDYAVINAAAYHDFVFTIVGSEYIYRFDTLDVFCTTVQNHYSILYFGSVPIGARTDSKSLHFTLKDNPSLVFIAGDTLTVRVYNINASAQTFYAWCQGTKFLRAVGYGHPPQASFTANALTPKVGDLVTFTDASLNTPDSWDYDYGDLTAHGTIQNPVHQYYTVGAMTPVQVATNQYGFDIFRRVSYITVSPTEDFTTYTEADPNSRITKSANTVLGTAITSNEDAYVYIDKGAGQINALNVYQKVVLASPSGVMGCSCFAITDAVGAVLSCIAKELTIFVYYDGTNVWFFVRYYFGNALLQQMAVIVAVNTYYYLRFVRAANSPTATLYVYSDPGFTVLVGSCSLTDASLANLTFRYMYAFSTFNYGNAYHCNLEVDNMSVL